jgi:hypothetical protein
VVVVMVAARRRARATALRVLPELEQRGLELLPDHSGLIGDLQALIEDRSRVLGVAGEK